MGHGSLTEIHAEPLEWDNDPTQPHVRMSVRLRRLSPVTAGTRIAASLACGVIAGLAGSMGSPAFGVLVGITVAASVFVVAGWVVLGSMDATATQRTVGREDFRPRVDELAVVGLALCGLGTIVALLVTGGTHAGYVPAGMAVGGVFMTWAALHLMYATRYAFLYYASGEQGGIDFNSEELPSYRDFLYFSYNLGMTYQVSDTAVTSSDIRGVVLRHCLLSYVFGVAILATTINLVAGALTT